MFCQSVGNFQALLVKVPGTSWHLLYENISSHEKDFFFSKAKTPATDQDLNITFLASLGKFTIWDIVLYAEQTVQNRYCMNMPKKVFL